jgi:hypothetical protein
MSGVSSGSGELIADYPLLFCSPCYLINLKHPNIDVVAFYSRK